MHCWLDAAQTYYIINYNKNFYPALHRLNLVVATIFSFYGSQHFQINPLAHLVVGMCDQAQEEEEELGHDCLDEPLDGGLLLTIFVYLLLLLRSLCERQGKENNSDPK